MSLCKRQTSSRAGCLARNVGGWTGCLEGPQTPCGQRGRAPVGNVGGWVGRAEGLRERHASSGAKHYASSGEGRPTRNAGGRAGCLGAANAMRAAGKSIMQAAVCGAQWGTRVVRRGARKGHMRCASSGVGRPMGNADGRVGCVCVGFWPVLQPRLLALGWGVWALVDPVTS